VRIGLGPEAPTLDLAGAWLDPDGGGHGDGATALVPAAVSPQGEAPPLVVTGDHTRWSLSGHTVVFEGHVRAERADVVLTSDTLTLTYTGQKVDRAIADGSVVVTRGDRRATADHGDLDVPSGKIALTGHPGIVEGPHHMVGESIALYLDDDRLECDRCRLEIDGSALAPSAP
jgi:lipopolysaccharide transport protein LptA